MLGYRIVSVILCAFALISCESTKDLDTESNIDFTSLSKRTHQSLSENGLFDFSYVYSNGKGSFVIGSSGSIFYMNYLGRSVMRIDAFGTQTRFAGGNAGSHVDGVGDAASFGDLKAIAIDRNDNIYVVDDNLLRKITPSRQVTTITTFSQKVPNEMAIDSRGNIFYVYDGVDNSCWGGACSANEIMKYSADGTISSFAGSGVAGNSNGQGSAASFSNPWDLVVDSHDNIFVADTGNFLIRKISPDADVTTFAGTGEPGIRDGKSKHAKFSFYFGQKATLAMGPNDILYVGDLTAASGYIRTIDSKGQVKTFCGNGSTTWTAVNATCADIGVWITGGIGVDRAGCVFYVFYQSMYKISDEESRARSSASHMNYTRSQSSAVKLKDGRVLVFGGVDSVDAPSEIYDPAKNAWSIGAVPMVPRRISGTAILLNDGRVLIGGGFTRTPPYGKSLREIEIFDPETNQFHLAALSANPRSGASFTLLNNGKVLILGGGYYDVASHYYNDGELFDPSNDSLSPIFNNMKHGRTSHSATVMANGNVLIAGGLNTGQEVTEIEVFQVANNAIVETNGLIHARYDMSSYLLPNGEMLLAGGSFNGVVNGNPGYVVPSTAVENYMSYGATENKPSLPEGMYFAGSTQLPDGRVVFVGGDSVTNGAGRDTIYILNLSTMTFELSNRRLSGLVRFNQLILLDDGKILSIGGGAGGTPSTQAERIELE